MKRRMRARHAQALVEYLLVAAAVLVAILGAREAFEAAIQALFANAATKATEAAANLNNLNVNVP